MATVNTSVSNGVSFGYRGAIGTTSAAEGEITVDFNVGYDIVANVQLQTSAGVNIGLSDTVLTYPAEGQVKLSNNMLTSIALANSLKTILNAHAADEDEHATAPDDVNFPVTTADASSLATLIALTGAMLTAYAAHDDDAELAAAWEYHIAQEASDHSLASVVAPTTIAEVITRLNDIKAKYNAHDADSTAHTTGSTHQEATTNASGATLSIGATNIINVVANRKK